ncbi:MAG: MBL fold metallo-hydrolase [Thermoprotei archaeon]
MEILFLGTGAGATLGTRRFKSGIAVIHEGVKVLLDMGSGVNYRVEDYDLVDFDALFVTHLHVDHFMGLFDHLVIRKMKGIPTLKVYSTPGLSQVLDAVVKAGNRVSAEVQESPLPKAKVGELEIYSVEACHTVRAVSYVVTDGNKKVVYSGDTSEPCEPILKEARDADLVIHEASCVTGCEQWGHTELPKLLSLIPTSKLVITHVPSWLEAEIYANSKGARVAYDGMRLNV